MLFLQLVVSVLAAMAFGRGTRVLCVGAHEIGLNEGAHYTMEYYSFNDTECHSPPSLQLTTMFGHANINKASSLAFLQQQAYTNSTVFDDATSTEVPSFVRVTNCRYDEGSNLFYFSLYWYMNQDDDVFDNDEGYFFETTPDGGLAPYEDRCYTDSTRRNEEEIAPNVSSTTKSLFGQKGKEIFPFKFRPFCGFPAETFNMQYDPHSLLSQYQWPNKPNYITWLTSQDAFDKSKGSSTALTLEPSQPFLDKNTTQIQKIVDGQKSSVGINDKVTIQFFQSLKHVNDSIAALSNQTTMVRIVEVQREVGTCTKVIQEATPFDGRFQYIRIEKCEYDEDTTTHRYSIGWFNNSECREVGNYLLNEDERKMDLSMDRDFPKNLFQAENLNDSNLFFSWVVGYNSQPHIVSCIKSESSSSASFHHILVPTVTQSIVVLIAWGFFSFL